MSEEPEHLVRVTEATGLGSEAGGDPEPSQYPPIPAYDFIGRCYDALHVDPLDFTEGALAEAQTFSFSPGSFISNISIAGSTYAKPNGVNYQSIFQGGQTSRITVFTTSTDYQKYLQTEGGLSVSDPASAAFSASLSYSAATMQKNVFESERSLSLTTAHYLTWKMTVSDLSKLALDEGLREQIEDLAQNEDNAPFDKIVQRFGTHYAHEVTFGGRAFQQIIMDSTAYSSLLEQSLDVKAELSATFEAAKAGGNWRNNWKASEAFKNAARDTVDDLRFKGGTPSASGFDMWYQSVANAPTAIGMTLRPLYELLQPKLFANVDASRLCQLQSALKTALEEYVKSNGQTRDDDALQYGNRVRLQFVRGQQIFWLAGGPDRKSVMLSRTGSGPDTIWTLSASTSDDRLHLGNPVRLKHEGSGMFLDARAGTDAEYLPDDGLVGLSANTGNAEFVDWLFSLALPSSDRSTILNRDAVRIETQFRTEGISAGFLWAPRNDSKGRLFSFGDQTAQGVVWRLVRL